MTDLPPPHLRERVFRQYELAIATAVNKYPLTTCFKSDIVSPTTFSARLRDAILSYKRFQWSTEKVNKNKFQQIEGDLCVRVFGDSVYVGPKTTALDSENIVPSATLPVESFWLTLTSPTEEVLKAICTILSERLETRPVKVMGPVTPQIQHLSLSYDISIKEESDHYLIL